MTVVVSSTAVVSPLVIVGSKVVVAPSVNVDSITVAS